MRESIGRFKLLLEAGFTLADVDSVLCPKPPSSNAARMLARLGIPESKRIWVDGKTAFRADVVLVPSFPGVRRNCQAWLVDFLRELAGIPPAPRDRKLFILRVGTRRKISNMDSLARALRAHGFETYDPLLHPDPPADFHAAEIVVGPHGTALDDLAFCQPGARVMELVPSDHIFPYYYTLSQAGRLEYGCLLGTSLGYRAADAFGPSPYDFCVDEDEFARALERIVQADSLPSKSASC
jgi:hypothetical protein